jgi:hypothetical protein
VLTHLSKDNLVSGDNSPSRQHPHSGSPRPPTSNTNKCQQGLLLLLSGLLAICCRPNLPTREPPSPGRDRTLYCAAPCDLNHAAVPHPPWDCNPPDDAPSLTAAQRATVPDGELPWLRYATRLVLSASEVDRLRSPIGRAMHALEVDELDRDLPDADRFSPRLEAVEHRLIRTRRDAERASTRLDVPARFPCDDANQLRQVMDEAAGRLGDLIRRRDATTPGYLLPSDHFTKAAQGLLDWSFATLERQQHRPTARTEPAITASLQLTDRDRAHLREEATHRRQTITEAVRQWPTGGGGHGER